MHLEWSFIESSSLKVHGKVRRFVESSICAKGYRLEGGNRVFDGVESRTVITSRVHHPRNNDRN